MTTILDIPDLNTDPLANNCQDSNLLYDQKPAPQRLWQTDFALTYEEFSGGTIPTDVVVYQAAMEYFVKPRGRIVLDVGCHTGLSTLKLASYAARMVVGFDASESSVANASKLFLIEDANFRFIHVGAGEENIPRVQVIAEGGRTQAPPYDSAFAGFVHPTISSKSELNLLFDKVGRALAIGGTLTAIGLNPGSLSAPPENYRYYRHALPNGQAYKDGLPFHNTLISADGNIIRFDDYCWTEDTLRSILLSCGFTDIQFIPVSRDIPAEQGGDVLRDILTRRNDLSQNEWDPSLPLYMIIHATYTGKIEEN